MFAKKTIFASLMIACVVTSGWTAEPAMNTANIEIGKKYNVDFINGTLIQILDDEYIYTALSDARTGKGRIEVVLKLKSTKGLTDPKAINGGFEWNKIIGSNVLECVDTKRVKLANGSSRTLYLLSPVIKAKE